MMGALDRLVDGMPVEQLAAEHATGGVPSNTRPATPREPQ
jgi:hypothetical protein